MSPCKVDGLQKTWRSHSLGTLDIGSWPSYPNHLPSLFMCQDPEHKFRETTGEVVGERTFPRCPEGAKGSQCLGPIIEHQLEQNERAWLI